MYARIKNNTVVGMFHSLPSTHENISGFDTLTKDELEAHGFYEVQETDGTYDPVTQVRIEQAIFNNGTVTRTYTVTDKVGEALSSALLEVVHKQRSAAYPDYREFIDGMVKIHSSDAAVSAAGDAQVKAYCDACLAVKLKYPKV